MNNDVFIIGEGFYLAFFFSSFNFTPFFIVIEMVDCFFHYIISYSFLRCLSEDNWDAAKPPKKIGQERITITKRKRKKKKKEMIRKLLAPAHCGSGFCPILHACSTEVCKRGSLTLANHSVMVGILITLLVSPGQREPSGQLFTKEPGYTCDGNM